MLNALTVETCVELLLQKDLFGSTLRISVHETAYTYRSGRMKTVSENVDLSTRWR